MNRLKQKFTILLVSIIALVLISLFAFLPSQSRKTETTNQTHDDLASTTKNVPKPEITPNNDLSETIAPNKSESNLNLPPKDQWTRITLDNYTLLCPGLVDEHKVKSPPSGIAKDINFIKVIECKFNNLNFTAQVTAYNPPVKVYAKAAAIAYAKHIKEAETTKSFKHDINIRSFNSHQGRILSGQQRFKSSTPPLIHTVFYMTENHEKLYQFSLLCEKNCSKPLSNILNTLNKSGK